MISKLYEKRLRRDLFRLSIVSIITVIIWIGMATYRSFSKSKIEPRLKKQIKPLTASIDLDTMKKIKGRQQIEAVNWNNLKPQLPEVLVLPELEATQSGGLASPSGQIASPSSELNNE